MICVGHRGAKGYEPENTIRSIRKAIELGVSWVEVDVHIVQNRLVVIHDETFERTTNGYGLVADSSIEYLRSLDAGKGEQIPFLEEVFQCTGKGVGVNIELKVERTAETVAHFIEQRIAEGWSGEQILVSSFNHQELVRLKSILHWVRTGALFVGLPVDYAAYGERIGAYSVNPAHEYVNEAFVEDAQRRGLKVWAFTVNTPEQVLRMKRCGVDAVFSDYPDRVLSLVS